MKTAEAALARLRDPEAEVSSHWLIAEDGRIWRLVDEAMRAWHAGAGRWGAVTDVNSHSIGIELANAGPLDGFPPFPEPQMAALEGLLDAISERWPIRAERVIGHSDMAPGRKADPGAKFDWRRLARGGRAVWVEAGAEAGAGMEAFSEAAVRAGYAAPDGDWGAVLEAFRLRFRPWAAGRALEAGDVAAARSLAAAHPCVDAAAASA